MSVLHEPTTVDAPELDAPELARRIWPPRAPELARAPELDRRIWPPARIWPPRLAGQSRLIPTPARSGCPISALRSRDWLRLTPAPARLTTASRPRLPQNACPISDPSNLGPRPPRRLSNLGSSKLGSKLGSVQARLSRKCLSKLGSRESACPSSALAKCLSNLGSLAKVPVQARLSKLGSQARLQSWLTLALRYFPGLSSGHQSWSALWSGSSLAATRSRCAWARRPRRPPRRPTGRRPCDLAPSPTDPRDSLQNTHSHSA